MLIKWFLLWFCWILLWKVHKIHLFILITSLSNQFVSVWCDPVTHAHKIHRFFHRNFCSNQTVEQAPLLPVSALLLPSIWFVFFSSSLSSLTYGIIWSRTEKLKTKVDGVYLRVKISSTPTCLNFYHKVQYVIKCDKALSLSNECICAFLGPSGR